MKITVLRKMRYDRSFIYIMQFEYQFQYLIPYDGDIYQDRITLLPGLFKRMLWKLGLIKTPYTSKQLEEGETIALSGAMKTLDTINDPKYKKARRIKIQKLEASRRAKGEKKCVWQARELKDDIYYYCLVHHEAVRMKDGEPPMHK